LRWNPSSYAQVQNKSISVKTFSIGIVLYDYFNETLSSKSAPESRGCDVACDNGSETSTMHRHAFICSSFLSQASCGIWRDGGTTLSLCPALWWCSLPS